MTLSIDLSLSLHIEEYKKEQQTGVQIVRLERNSLDLDEGPWVANTRRLLGSNPSSDQHESQLSALCHN
jgi:hypothetical protein